MSGENISVTWFDTLGASPRAAQFAMLGWLEMIEKGYIDGLADLAFHINMPCGVASVHGAGEPMPAGVMVYSIDATLGRIWIDMSWTAHEYRGQGVYTAMWQAMIANARSLGMSKIQSATSIRNEGMRRIAKKQGRIERVIQLDYMVPIDE